MYEFKKCLYSICRCNFVLILKNIYVIYFVNKRGALLNACMRMGKHIKPSLKHHLIIFDESVRDEGLKVS